MSREYLFPEYQKVSKKISLKMLDQKLSEQGFPAAYAFAFFAMVIFKQTMEYTAIQSLTFVCIKMGAWGPKNYVFGNQLCSKCHASLHFKARKHMIS